MPWTLSQVIFHPWQFLASACSLSAPAQGCPGKGTEVRPLSSPTRDLSQVVGGKSQRGDNIMTPVFIIIVTVAVSPLSPTSPRSPSFPPSWSSKSSTTMATFTIHHHHHLHQHHHHHPITPFTTILTFTIAIMAIATTITSTITPSLISITAY